MWHVCVGEKQTDGNCATQWFMFGVQGSHHRGKKRGNHTAKVQKTSENQTGKPGKQELIGLFILCTGITLEETKTI